MSLELVAGVCIGATLGLISGIVVSKRLGLTPSAKELEKALTVNNEYYKTTIQRLKGRMKEYEQPTDLQNLSNKMNGLQEGDMVSMLANNLGSIAGIPKWIRPFLPGVQSYIKEHPEEVKLLVNKFISGGKQASSEEFGGDML